MRLIIEARLAGGDNDRSSTVRAFWPWSTP
jgi:hypothetical protein